MPIKITADDVPLRAKMEQISKWKNITFAEVVRRHARLCCVELARRTQPFGDSNDAKAAGERAVERDIRKLYKDSESLLAMVRQWKATPWQRAIVAALERDDMDVVFVLLQETKSWLKDRVREVPNRITHKTFRTGRRASVKTGGYFQIIRNAASLASYIKNRQMMVGFTKSVWWTIAQQIKTSLARPERGLPKWVRRHNAPGDVVDLTKDTDYPVIEMRSRLSWMNDVLPDYEQSRAAEIVHDKMIKYIEYTWKAELRKMSQGLTSAA